MDRIALFDFDGTLVEKDSFLEFAKFACGGKGLAVGAIMSMRWLIGWNLGLIDSSQAKERLFGNLFKGMRYEEFCRYGEEFSRMIDRMINHEVYAQLIMYMNDFCARCVVVTASMRQWVEPWAASNGITKVIATEPEVGDDGRLTGRFATPNCKGAEKVARIRKEFPDIDDMEVFAWGNLPEDRWMFDLAIESHIV